MTVACLLDDPRIVSVRHPYAWAILHGKKDVENRGHSVRHRGPVLIHAGKACPKRYVEETLEDLVELDLITADQRPSFAQLRETAGHILGLVDLVACEPNPCDSPWAAIDGFAWRLANPRVLVRPIPYRAMLGLLRCPAEIVAQIESIGFETGAAS